MKIAKRIFVFIFALLLFSLSFIFSNRNVKAIVATDSNITVLGASVRTTGNAGIRFDANVGSYDTTNVKAYGIAIAFGDANVDDIVVGGSANGKSVLSQTVNELDGEGEFHIVLYGVPEASYTQLVSARAYVVLNDDSLVYSTSKITRDLWTVAAKAKSDNVSGDLLDSVVNYVNTHYMVKTTTSINQFVISNVNDKYYNVYKLDDLRSEFIADFLATTGENITFTPGLTGSSLSTEASAFWDIFSNDLTNNNVRTIPATNNAVKFFSGANFVKWSWLLDYFKNNYGTHISNQANALLREDRTCQSYDGYCLEHLSYSIYNFFTGNEKDGYYIAAHFSNLSNYSAVVWPTVTNCNQENIVRVGDTINLPDALSAPDGYEFDQYHLVGGASYDALAEVVVTNSNMVFTHTFRHITHNVTYVLNGGTNNLNNPNNIMLDNDRVELYPATKNNNVFLGWYDNESFTGDSISAIEANTNENITLYARFTSVDKYVSASWSNKNNGDTVTVDDTSYTIGTNAFASIASALAAANAGDTIYVLSGVYNANFTINANNVKLYGPFGGISGDNYNRLSNGLNAVISNATVTLGAEKNNLVIQGFKFVGSSQVVNTNGSSGTSGSTKTNLNGFIFKNNLVDTSHSGINSFIKFTEASHSYSKSLLLEGNKFTNFGDVTHLIDFNNNAGLTIKGNSFYDISGDAIYVTDNNKGLAGNLNIENNIFSNVSGSAFFTNWYSPLTGTNPDVLIKGNVFDSVSGGACIDFETTNDGDASNYNTFIVEENVFKNVYKCLWKYNTDNVEFTHNVVYQYPNNNTSGYVTSANSGGYDCASNLYLSKNAGTVYTSVYTTATTSNNGFRFNTQATEDNVNGSNFDSISAYNNASYRVKVPTYNGYIDASYVSNSYVTISNSIDLSASFITTGSSPNLVWVSLDPEIVSVSDGTVTGEREGVGRVVCYLENESYKHVTFVVSVVSDSISASLNFALSSHNSNINEIFNLYIDGNAPFYDDVVGSVSKILFNNDLSIDTSYESVQEANTNSNHGGTKSSTEFITVHYTANNSSSAGAKMHANYFATNASTSIHYTTGNDGVYHILDDSLIAYHAGDGGSGTFSWSSTGVLKQAGDPTYPIWGISSDSYFTINGRKTTVKVPTDKNGQSVTNARYINDMGLAFKIVNGEYYMGKTWWCYTQVAEGRICSAGGNRNSIGIETAVNKGADLWLTWQKTAQLVAKLMKDNHLDITRVVGHHFFSAKDCPQPLLENDLEAWWYFIDLVKSEYDKLMNYSNYTYSISSVNAYNAINSNGRVTSIPSSTRSLVYEVTVTNNSTSETESVVLASMILGLESK